MVIEQAALMLRVDGSFPWNVEIDLAPIAAAAHIADTLGGQLVEYPGADHFFFAHAGDIGAQVTRWWQQHEPAHADH